MPKEVGREDSFLDIRNEFQKPVRDPRSITKLVFDLKKLEMKIIGIVEVI